METHAGAQTLAGIDEKGKEGNNLLSIRGIVIPAEWDEEGNVVAVAVSGYDEVEYLLENNEKGKELKAFIREEVEVSGILKQEKNRLIIEGKEYRLNRV